MEMAQFDDTELESSEIKSTWQTLTENGGKKLELEFARLANMVDDRKALAVGTSEQNRAKNQSDTVIPFDRNRVILTPDGQRPDSTYINASFIEGYYNDESFIITQDPLPSTTEGKSTKVNFSILQFTLGFDEIMDLDVRLSLIFYLLSQPF